MIKLRPFQGGQVPAGGKDLAAETFTAIEITAGLRSVGVDGAEVCGWIEGDTGAVAALIHAASAGMLHHEFLRHDVARPQLDHQVAAAAAAGARGKIRMRVDGTRVGRCPTMANYNGFIRKAGARGV